MKSAKNNPIEHFVWSQEQASDKVIYFDQNGDCIERPVPRGVLEDVLKIFDGKLRSIRRTSGGISLCEPHQLVIYDRTILDPQTLWKPNREGQPLIRVRVRIPELIRDLDGKVIGPNVILQTKVVIPTELQPPFLLKSDSLAMTFLDTGNGILPISVFHVDEHSSEPMAYFTEPGRLTEVQGLKPGSPVSINLYSVPLRTLRIPNPDNSFDIARAQENLHRLRNQSVRIIPDTLKLEGEFQVPSGRPVEYLRSVLTAMLDPKTKREIEPLILNVENKEDELLPFGIFEPS